MALVAPGPVADAEGKDPFLGWNLTVGYIFFLGSCPQSIVEIDWRPETHPRMCMEMCMEIFRVESVETYIHSRLQ
jgi:hypothetical protein